MNTKSMALFGVLCLLMMAMEARAQATYAIGHIPKALLPRANAILRHQEWTLDIRAPENVVLSVKQAVTVMNKTADNYGALAVFYDKSMGIKSLKAELYDEDGLLLGKIGEKNFVDESAVSSFSLFEDSRVKYHSPNVHRYPYTIVYQYELHLKQSLVLPEWIANPHRDMAVEESVYTVIAAADGDLRIKEYNYHGSRAEELQTKQRTRIYRWQVNAVSAARPEPLGPRPETYQTRVKVAPVQFAYYRKKGEYRDWKELGKWVYDDLLKERQVPSMEMIAKANALLQGITDEREKVKILYAYMQEKTRYISVQIGIGGYLPMAATEVDRLSYGDCKALVNYMQSLLSIAQIPSYYCVVNAGSLKRDMDPEFASMSQGNHVILAVPIDADTIWLECTSQKSPFGFLGDFTDDRLVWACTEDGGKLLRTPRLSAADNTQQRQVTITMNEDGDLQGRMLTVFSGAQYDNHLLVAEAAPSEQHRKLKEIYDVDHIDFKTIRYAKSDSAWLQEDITLAIRKYGSRNDKRIYFQPNFFNRKSSVPEFGNRSLPLYLNRGYTDEDAAVFELPSGVSVEIKPENLILKTAFGEFLLETKLVGNRLLYHRKLVMQQGTFLPEQYDDYVSFVAAIRKADLAKMVLLME